MPAIQRFHCIRNNMQDSTFGDIDFSDFSIFLFKAEKVVIDEQCSHHLKLLLNGGKRYRKSLTKRSYTFYKPINVYPVTYALGEHIFSNYVKYSESVS